MTVLQTWGNPIVRVTRVALPIIHVLNVQSHHASRTGALILFFNCIDCWVRRQGAGVVCLFALALECVGEVGGCGRVVVLFVVVG